MNKHVSTDAHLDGHAVDFLPWPPTPFTWSMFQAGWENARRRLASQLGSSPTTPAWVNEDGRVREDESFWRALASHLRAPGPSAAQVLGVSPTGWPQPAPRRRGFLGRWRRSGDPWQRHAEQVGENLRRTRRWVRGVRETRWSQADLLQVMEEIAPELGQMLSDWVLTSLALADAAAEAGIEGSDWPELVRGADIAPGRLLRALAEVYRALADDTAARSWLADPEEEPPQALASFWRTHFWLSIQPFEAATPRWVEHPQPLVEHMSARVRAHRPVQVPPGVRSDDRVIRWLALREQVRVTVAQVVTAARVWVLAAAEEALEDGRLAAREDAFFLTLEELKQMMTGEWNRAEQVRPHVRTRREAYARHEGAVPTSIPLDTAQTSVFARGWQPGWALVALEAEELVTASRSSVSYGHLLAYLLGKKVREAHGS